MAKSKAKAYYSEPDEFLQQGDIYRVSLVGPAADTDARILRSHDGRHGSVVFEENCEARVFGVGSLRQVLDGLPSRSQFHTEPFAITDDGQGELVVVYARLFRYFVVASHTCDVSGKDKNSLPWAIILPVFTLAEMCRTERRKFKSQQTPMTVEAFLALSDFGSELSALSEAEFPRAARKAVKAWIESGLTGKILKDAEHVRNYLNQYHAPGFLFSLPANEALGLPESCVDFSAAFTVPVAKLSAIGGCRIARIEEPYRSSFSRRFADLFSRPTLPVPMTPDTST